MKYEFANMNKKVYTYFTYQFNIFLVQSFHNIQYLTEVSTPLKCL